MLCLYKIYHDMMKLGLLGLIVITLTVGCVEEEKKEQGDRGYHAEIGDIVENIEFSLIDGTIISLAELKGKVVVLQFTASWCSVCRKEMPFLESEVWQKYKDEDFVLIGVDLDEPKDKVVQFVEKMNTTYPMSLDPDGEIFHKFAFKNSGVTRNVVIDKDGKIAYLTRLFEREEFNKMKEKIEQLVFH